jgi:hypothetical protein
VRTRRAGRAHPTPPAVVTALRGHRVGAGAARARGGWRGAAANRGWRGDGRATDRQRENNQRRRRLGLRLAASATAGGAAGAGAERCAAAGCRSPACGDCSRRHCPPRKARAGRPRRAPRRARPPRARARRPEARAGAAGARRARAHTREPGRRRDARLFAASARLARAEMKRTRAVVPMLALSRWRRGRRSRPLACAARTPWRPGCAGGACGASSSSMFTCIVACAVRRLRVMSQCSAIPSARRTRRTWTHGQPGLRARNTNTPRQ